MRSALLLCPEAPYPMTGGGSIRTASLAQYLGERYALDIIAFREPDAPDPRSAVPAGIARDVHVFPLPRHGRGRLARITRNTRRLLHGRPPLNDRFGGFGPALATWLDGRRYDIAIVEHFWCAPYAEQMAGHAARLVLDLHNIESVLYAGSASAEPLPLSIAMRRFAAACTRLERLWLPRFDLLLVTSEADAERVRRLAPGVDVAVYPNALPFRAEPTCSEEDVIAFSGNMEYHPNSAAVRYFSREMWPALQREHPGIVWRLIGKNDCAIAPYTKGDPNIQVSGAVDDAVAALAAARVAIVPLLAGSGTRLKILEAWAAGRAVVSTSVGAEGLGARDGEHLIIADTPASFASAVGRLLASAEDRRRIGRAGRRFYEERFTWERAWSELSAVGL
ncbi:MAG TPA: glycosyltransferase [Bryobacteraceae bacterium]|nr:glycosyltransferase [Bryobacteraceae bacterium]